MPYVFHTKTIQSILDPVAQQVAELLLIHEEAKDGRIVADLMAPVAAVSSAVGNLVVIGKQTADQSKDEKLKNDMPPAIAAIQEATKLSSEAAEGLSGEEQSAADKKKLLDGSSGILNGVSLLLLVFDQSEVRKLVKQCENIMEYLKVAEMVETTEDVGTFDANIGPSTMSIMKQVDARRGELTNVSHAAILEDEINQVRMGIPILLSALKMLVNLKQSKSEGVMDAHENRNFIVSSLSESLKEIIRVLQLTSPTEEPGSLGGGGGAGQSTGGAPPGTMAANIHQAKELLQETGKSKVTDEAGISAVSACISEARKLAQSFTKDKRMEIEKLCDELDAMTKELAALEAKGQGSSAAARAIADAISQKLDTLEKALKYEATNEVVSAFKDPLGPLKAVTQAAQAPLDTPNRKEVFADRVGTFEVHCKAMSETAADLAKAGGVMDKNAVEELMRSSAKVKKLGPQVVHAANILFNNPDNERAKSHYQTMEAEYSTQVSKLQKLVDSSVDPLQFVSASEAQIQHDLEEAKACIKSGNAQKAFELVASATRKAKRLECLIENEIENTDELQFKQDLQKAKENIVSSIAPVVTSARAAILQPNNELSLAQFSQQADKLVKNVHEAYSVMDNHFNPPPPPLPPAPIEEEAPSRPPLPVEEEVEEEEEEAPLQEANPIGFAAHQLHQDAKQWEDKDNDMVSAAKRMAKLMMQMAKFAKGEEGEVTSKKEFIQTARKIAKESEEVVKMARKVAKACTDKRMATILNQTLDAIPTIATQLKIIAAVKASRQGGDDPKADKEATEMLTDNAQNLMKAVSDVLYSTEAASIRVPPSARDEIGLTWVKRSTKGKASLTS